MKTTKRILTAPLTVAGWLAAFLLEVLSNINPLLLLVCLFSDE
jgi:hypothetical protein